MGLNAKQYLRYCSRRNPGSRISDTARNGDVRSTKNVTPSRSSIAATALSWRRHASAQMIVHPAAICSHCPNRSGRRGRVSMSPTFAERNMRDIEFIRAQIEHMRTQAGRHRNEILQLQRAGISTASPELLLGRMLAKIDNLCAQRDALKKELPHH